MSENLKNAILTYNTQNLIEFFVDIIVSGVQFVLPIVGAIAVGFFGYKIVRSLLHL